VSSAGRCAEGAGNQPTPKEREEDETTIFLLVAAGATLALFAGVALAQATTHTEVRNVAVEGTGENPCNGEPISWHGEYQGVFHYTIDGNGGVHVQGSLHLLRGGAVGAVSGDTYRIVEQSSSETFAGPLPLEDTAQGTFILLRKGSGDNYLVKYAFHFTINDNGEIWVGDYHVAECKG
jgi:hypothetical protein